MFETLAIISCILFWYTVPKVSWVRAAVIVISISTYVYAFNEIAIKYNLCGGC